ncbi:hypothetical protein E2C01_100688 [Portunus trituberculatus]|uniref:Uncharacterized protein n=1 Tax=Portunus trituberculatus TaxID=210409 RepID=A0A5B7K8Q4_PORTR|nr:hypothetical protein [Portunus trituberculatus]
MRGAGLEEAERKKGRKEGGRKRRTEAAIPTKSNQKGAIKPRKCCLFMSRTLTFIPYLILTHLYLNLYLSLASLGTCHSVSGVAALVGVSQG